LANNVAPRAGAWIETQNLNGYIKRGTVAPRAGAWIETDQNLADRKIPTRSRPARARGLKRLVGIAGYPVKIVAPRAGAWIETISWDCRLSRKNRRAPRGRVD